MFFLGQDVVPRADTLVEFTYSMTETLKKWEEETEYFGSDSVSTTTNYEYNNSLQCSATIENVDENLIKKTTYSYPDDYTTISNNISTLKAKHIISKPIDTRQYINTNLTAGRQIKYNIYGLPTDIYTAETEGQDVSFDGSNPYTFAHNSTYQYDNSLLKISQQIKDHDYPTSYLWDSNGNYTIAKVENAIYDDIKSLDGKISSFSSVSLYDSIKAIVPNAMITTFSYSPLWGITSQTDPNGVTTYYEHDDFGRLARIRNNDNEIVQEYDYHYVVPSNFSTSESSLSYTSASSSKSVSVTSDVSWTVTDNQSWIMVSPSSGTNNGSFSVTCTSNTSTSSRSGTVTVTGGGITRIISISQVGATPSKSGLSASRTFLAFLELGSVENVNVSSDTSWRATPSDSWINVSPTRGTGNGTIRISADELLSGNRSGTVTLSTTDGTQTVTINIFQDAGGFQP